MCYAYNIYSKKWGKEAGEIAKFHTYKVNAAVWPLLA